RSPTWRLVSLKVPEALTYASSPLPTAVMAGKPGTSGCGTGRFRRRACAPDRLIRPACYSEGEEPNQPGLAAIRRPAPRRPRLLSDHADGPEAQQRIQA